MDADECSRDEAQCQPDGEEGRQAADPPYPLIRLFRRRARDSRQQDRRNGVGDVEDELVHGHGHAVLAEGIAVVAHLGLDDVRVGPIIEVARKERRCGADPVRADLPERRRLVPGARLAETPHRHHDRGGRQQVVRHRSGNGPVDAELHQHHEYHDKSQENGGQPELDQVVDLYRVSTVQNRAAERRDHPGGNGEQNHSQQVVRCGPED